MLGNAEEIICFFKILSDKIRYRDRSKCAKLNKSSKSFEDPLNVNYALSLSCCQESSIPVLERRKFIFPKIIKLLTLLCSPSTNILASAFPLPSVIGAVENESSTLSPICPSSSLSRASVVPSSENSFTAAEETFPSWNRWKASPWEKPKAAVELGVAFDRR